MKLTDDFKQAVYDVVRQVPEGRVMTYGDVAAAAGAPGAAWEVGQIAHWAPCQKLGTCDARADTGGTLPAGVPLESICPACDLPWQRVVNKQGGLARAYTWGGLEGHARELEAEGIEVDDYMVNIAYLIWFPDEQ